MTTCCGSSPSTGRHEADALKLVVDEVLPGAPDQVLAAFTDAAFLASLHELEKIGAPEVLGQQRDGDLVRQQVRYHFAGELSPVVTAAVDRSKLVWVDEHTYDLAARKATFVIVPEHYGERLDCSGWESFHAIADGTAWHVEAELKVGWPVVGHLVERAIASGLKETLRAEVSLVERWLESS